jgi:hypothetical protein
MTWYQPEPRMDRWLELYRAVARGNGAEPDAGRRLLAWAHAARYREVVSTATVWCYGTLQERAWWVGCGRNASPITRAGSPAVQGGEEWGVRHECRCLGLMLVER